MTRRQILIIGGTAVYLHLATVIVAMYMVLLGLGWTLVVAGLSVLLHEAAHAVVSACFGAPPIEIELTPLGALMRQEDEERLPPAQRLLMLLAGPMMSLVLCWLALMLTRNGILSVAMGRMFFMSNMTLLLLNLLPALPLDGGRVIALLLSLKFRQETVRRTMRIMGTVLGFACLLSNLVITFCMGGWNLSLAAAGCFLMYAGTVGTTSTAMAELRQLMDRRIRLEKQGWLPCRWVAVTDRAPLRHAVARLRPGQHTMYIVIETGTQKQLASVPEEELIGAYLEHPGEKCEVLIRDD